MIRRELIIFLILSILILILLYPKSSGKNTIYYVDGKAIDLGYSLDELKNISINITKKSYELREKYNLTLIVFDPEGRGNYTAALLTLKFNIPYAWPVCLYYEKGCIYYFGNLSEPGYLYIFYKPEKIIYKVKENLTLQIYLENSNETKIYMQDNKIFIEGDKNTIRKAVAKFLVWWYGIENS